LLPVSAPSILQAMVKKPCCLFRTPHLKHKTGTDVQSASGFTIVAFEKAAIVEDIYGKYIIFIDTGSGAGCRVNEA
jgi:hypothetical protein